MSLYLLALLTIAILAVAPDASPTCEQSKTVFTLVTDSKKNWYQAFADCRTKDMHLASIENEEEYQQVLSQINALDDHHKNVSFWLSATDLGQEHRYVWMSSGHSVSLTKWCPGEPDQHSHHPNNEVEHCVELRHKCAFGMNDEICSLDNNYYICEKRIPGSYRG